MYEPIIFLTQVIVVFSGLTVCHRVRERECFAFDLPLEFRLERKTPPAMFINCPYRKEICPAMQVNEMCALYDEHHSVLFPKKAPKHTKFCQI